MLCQAIKNSKPIKLSRPRRMSRKCVRPETTSRSAGYCTFAGGFFAVSSPFGFVSRGRGPTAGEPLAEGF